MKRWMKTGLFILGVLIAQYFLEGWILMLTLVLIGILAGYFLQEEKKFSLKVMVILLILSGLLLGITNLSNSHLSNLANHSTVTLPIWSLVVILINAITAFFCITVPYYCFRYTAVRLSNKH